MSVKKEEKTYKTLSVSGVCKKRTTYVCSNGREFSDHKSAVLHEKRLGILEEFEKCFSEKKGNLKTGDIALADVLIPLKGKSEYDDFFWVKIDNKENDKKEISNFFSKFYRAAYKGPLFEEDEEMSGWVFIIVINTHTSNLNKWQWVNLETLKSVVKKIENSYPDNVKKLEPLAKNESLLDLD